MALRLLINCPVCLCMFFRFSTSAICSSLDDSEFLHRSIVPTDHFQASLPRLPVPKLEDSTRRYLAALAPVLTPEDLRMSQRIVDAFRDEEGKREHTPLSSILSSLYISNVIVYHSCINTCDSSWLCVWCVWNRFWREVGTTTKFGV